MIAHVVGTVVEKLSGSLIVDVHGVGYEVSVTRYDYDTTQLHDEVTFYTYHHIREQSQELFGFLTLSAKKLFELLITVQGVGPKAGLSVLSIGSSEEVRAAIAGADSTYIAKANGVGKKTAERIVVDLHDKVGAPSQFSSTALPGAHIQQRGDEALEALMALGYSLQDASDALEGVSLDLSTAERVTEALKQ